MTLNPNGPATEDCGRPGGGEEKSGGSVAPTALEVAVSLVGRPLGELGLLRIGLGLGQGAGLDGRVELGLAVSHEGVDHDLEVDVVSLGHVGDGLAALERGLEVGFADPDRLGDDGGIGDRLDVTAAGAVTAAPTALEVAVVSLGHVGDGLAALERGLEVGLADPDRLRDDGGIADGFDMASTATAGTVLILVTRARGGGARSATSGGAGRRCRRGRGGR